MNTTGADWQVFDNAEQVAREACRRITQLARQAVREHGEFHFVLAGGTTPARVYELLTECDCDWPQWGVGCAS